MNMQTSIVRDPSTEAFDTRTLLSKAREQAQDRKYEDFMIIDVDAHHYETQSYKEIFDYIEDPVSIVRAMREKTRQTMIMSFPKAYEWRVPVRRVRFLFAGCPLFLYTKSRVASILKEAGLERCDWIDLGRDYLIVAHLEG